jgi:hypothetical protein
VPKARLRRDGGGRALVVLRTPGAMRETAHEPMTV